MLKFYMPDHEDIDELRAVPKSTENNPQWFAKEAAEYVFDNEDGWEMGWPQIFAIVDENGTERRFNVGMEYIPSFYIDAEICLDCGATNELTV